MHVLVCMSWSSRALVLENFRQQENWINWEELPCFWKVIQLEIRPQSEAGGAGSVFKQGWRVLARISSLKGSNQKDRVQGPHSMVVK